MQRWGGGVLLKVTLSVGLRHATAATPSASDNTAAATQPLDGSFGPDESIQESGGWSHFKLAETRVS